MFSFIPPFLSSGSIISVILQRIKNVYITGNLQQSSFEFEQCSLHFCWCLLLIYQKESANFFTAYALALPATAAAAAAEEDDQRSVGNGNGNETVLLFAYAMISLWMYCPLRNDVNLQNWSGKAIISNVLSIRALPRHHFCLSILFSTTSLYFIFYRFKFNSSHKITKNEIC